MTPALLGQLPTTAAHHHQHQHQHHHHTGQAATAVVSLGSNLIVPSFCILTQILESPAPLQSSAALLQPFAGRSEW